MYARAKQHTKYKYLSEKTVKKRLVKPLDFNSFTSAKAFDKMTKPYTTLPVRVFTAGAMPIGHTIGLTKKIYHGTRDYIE